MASANRLPLRRRSMRRLRQLLTFAFNLALYPLSISARRSPRRWVFGHKGEIFGGNPKYLFMWMTLHRPDIRVTWITGSRETRLMLAASGYPVEARWSWRGMAAALRAKVFVFSHDAVDVNAALSRGAMHLNLWHGVGLKRLHVGQKPVSPLLGWFRSFLALPHDTVVSTSDMMETYFSTQFQIPRERCPQLGYPRLDAAQDAALSSAAKRMDQSAGFQLKPDAVAEVYFYAPTFRDTGRPLFPAAFPDLDRLAATLQGRNAILYLKPHPQTKEDLPVRANIRRWPDEIDFHTYLEEFTGLITDYSSVIYDYLFVKSTGAILYTFDYDEYTSKDRQLVYPFDENVAGLRVATFDRFCEVLRDGTALDPTIATGVDRIRERFWSGSTSPASAAIIDYVERELSVRADKKGLR